MSCSPRSVPLSDNSSMYARFAELATSLSTAIAAQITPRIPEDRRPRAERDLDFAIRAALARPDRRHPDRDALGARTACPTAYDEGT